jgi:hypothetical protein
MEAAFGYVLAFGLLANAGVCLVIGVAGWPNRHAMPHEVVLGLSAASVLLLCAGLILKRAWGLQ